MNVGRNLDEILRVIDALQLADAKMIATPADWQKGGEVIILKSIDTAAAKEQVPQGWKEIRPVCARQGFEMFDGLTFARDDAGRSALNERTAILAR